jgi:methylglutaconyl-CoA hydratase
MPGFEHIVVDRGPVAHLTLNRPSVRNAMSDKTLRELAQAFKELGADHAVRAVVVRGEGVDFCAGADVEWMKKAGTLPPEQGKADARLLADMLRAVDECPIPVIVAAHGNVFGGGLGLVAACDIAILAEDAKLCFSETKLGILPAVISSWVLPKIGAANARRYYLTAEVFTAPQAVLMGLAHEWAPFGDLIPRAEACAKSVLKNGPQAVATAKAMIPRLEGKTLEQKIEFTVETLVRLRSSPEGQEGLKAFLEKRKPSWIENKSS